jgi:arylsulfatase A-like enzyme
MHSPPCRFLIVVFDSLRPDRLSANQTPNLYEFCRNGVVFSKSRAVFPTLTRVNKVSLVTGTTPSNHGVLFNMFYDPAVFQDRIVDIGDMDDVLAADAGGHRLITAPTLGEILARSGRKLAAVHTGMPGAPWLVNYRGAQLGHCHFSIHGPQFSTPVDLATEVVDRLGAIPASRHPNRPRLDYAVNAFQEIIYPRAKPDVAVLWLNEPDHTSHHYPAGSDVMAAALQDIDDVFGRILAWWAAKGRRDGVQIIAMSDHGCIPGHTRLDINGLLNQAGFPAGRDPSAEGEIVSLPGSVGAIYLRGTRNRLLPDIVGWMQNQEWCGHLFTDGPAGVEGRIPGTFSHSLAGIAHRRAPDLVYTLRSRTDGSGCYYDSGKPVDTGQHGGLNPLEIHNVLAFGGEAFAGAHRSSAPVGIVDIAPTVLDLMGLAIPPSMTGRALREAYAAAPQDSAPVREQIYETGTGNYTQRVRICEQGSHRYIDGGWLD